MKQDNDDAKVPDDVEAAKSSAPTEDSKSPTSDFRPIRIKGEPLSATILRERR